MYFIRSHRELAPTQKIFHEEPYLTSLRATVLHVQDDLVVLDRTIFYAESGGQVADRGFIDDVEVVDVQKVGGRSVYVSRDGNRHGLSVPPVEVDTVTVHRCTNPAAFTVGQPVTLTIDWPYRYRAMRNHSAAHFLFLAVREVCRLQDFEPFTKGCHITDQSFRFDFAAKFDSAMVTDISAQANAWIAEGLPITMEPDAAISEVLYWLYGSLVVPCGGTHVRSARELAPIRVRRQSQGRSVDRLAGELTQCVDVLP